MDELKPPLFISHATWQANENLRANQIRQRLFDLLKTDWEVFVDKERLKPGDKWRPAILNALSNAQAGIILFDETAVEKSDWVKAEALIMCFRYSIDPDFQLIPVLLEDLKPEDKRLESYRPFQLGEITFQSDDTGKSVNAVCREIAARLKPEAARVPKNFRGWMWEFEGLLDGMNRATLVEAWKRLVAEMPATGVNNDDELRRAVVQLFHHSKPLETISAARELKRQLLNEKYERITSLIKQKWIENESVEIVFGSTRFPRNKILLIYHTPEDVSNTLEFIDCLFSRLQTECPADQLIKKFSIAETAGEGNDAIRLHIEKTIKGNLGSKSYPPESDKYMQKIRDNLSRPQWLTICHIPQAYAKSEVLEPLHLKYPEIVFLVQVNCDEDKNQFENAGGKNLTPGLNDDKIDEFEELRDTLESIFT